MAKPKLRFPEFTDEWEEKQLKDFMIFKNGLNADKDKFGSGIKFISVMDILNNPFITYDVIRGKVNVDEKTLKNYSVTYGDVLFQRSSETREDAGKSNVYLDKENTATFGGFVIRGKKTGDYSPEFMNSLLKSQRVRKEITSKAQGAQHINVGQETLENVSITLPTIKEQERIAELLSSVDDLIQVQEKEIIALEEQKKGTMQKLFNREVRFKADDGSEYPEWKEKMIGDFCSVQMCKRIFKEQTQEKGEIPFYKIGTIGGTPDAYISRELFEQYKLKYNYPRRGEFLISCSGTVGRCVIYDGQDAYYQDSNIVWLRNDDDSVLNSFLYLLISNVNWKCLNSTTITRIYGDDLRQLRFLFPCIDEQQKIADCLSAYDEAILVMQDKLEVWKEIKKGLLQQMFV